jgi:hypothetical protein
MIQQINENELPIAWAECTKYQLIKILQQKRFLKITLSFPSWYGLQFSADEKNYTSGGNDNWIIGICHSKYKKIGSKRQHQPWKNGPTNFPYGYCTG